MHDDVGRAAFQKAAKRSQHFENINPSDFKVKMSDQEDEIPMDMQPEVAGDERGYFFESNNEQPHDIKGDGTILKASAT